MVHFKTIQDFGPSYMLKPSFPWTYERQASYAHFCVFPPTRFASQAYSCYSFNPIVIKLDQHVDLPMPNNLYF